MAVPPATVRVDLTAPSDTIHIGEYTEFRAFAFDAAGAVIPGAPIVVERIEQTTRTVADSGGQAAFTFDSAGSYTLIARFGGKADTLRALVLGSETR